MAAIYRIPLVCTAVLALSASASAHVSLSSPAFATKSAQLTFTIGHGCEGKDTVSLDVAIPKEITALRALPSPSFTEVLVIKDDTDAITNVVWSKEAHHDTDDLAYQLSIRTTVPDLPFSTLYFPATQTCLDADGKTLVTDWAALPGDPPLDDGSEAPPAPALLILPARLPGWNKLTAPADIDDLKAFADAQIVWVGDAAYSPNPTTAELIAAEADVTLLKTIAAGDEIWVKY